MHITNIELNKIHMFEKFQAKLEPNINNIVGTNGSGKKTLVNTINKIIGTNTRRINSFFPESCGHIQINFDDDESYFLHVMYIFLLYNNNKKKYISHDTITNSLQKNIFSDGIKINMDNIQNNTRNENKHISYINNDDVIEQINNDFTKNNLSELNKYNNTYGTNISPNETIKKIKWSKCNTSQNNEATQNENKLTNLCHMESNDNSIHDILNVTYDGYTIFDIINKYENWKCNMTVNNYEGFHGIRIFHIINSYIFDKIRFVNLVQKKSYKDIVTHIENYEEDCNLLQNEMKENLAKFNSLKYKEKKFHKFDVINNNHPEEYQDASDMFAHSSIKSQKVTTLYNNKNIKASDTFIDKQTKLLNDYIDNMDGKCMEKNTHNIKTSDPARFKLMQQYFNDATQKKFDVKQICKDGKYVYIIGDTIEKSCACNAAPTICACGAQEIHISHHTQYNVPILCSTGEIELINFLYEYTDNDAQIMFLDKPFINFSSKIRAKLITLLNNSGKQIIFTSYDCEPTNELVNVIQIAEHNDTSTKKTNSGNDISTKNKSLVNTFNDEFEVRNEYLNNGNYSEPLNDGDSGEPLNDGDDGELLLKSFF